MTPSPQVRSRDRSSGKERPRPADDGGLGFTRTKRVSWYSPGVLATAAQRVALSAAFGDFLDKRELQQAIPIDRIDRSSGQELWFDYMADTGDGFDATYSMAWLTARPELSVDGLAEPLPRGRLLVLGGDEVYPVAGPEEYDNRFRGPFKASLPWTAEGSPKPEVLALPGNHDWYDGLTNFMRLFCAGQDIGGRATVQTRSYFAVELPHRWWIWGIDIQFDAYIDDPQLTFFGRVAKQMGEGARLILATAVPSWVDANGDPRAFHNLGYLESRVIRPAGIKLMVSLSGDSHHYAHYAGDANSPSEGTHKITAGGGGAFLHPTHHNDPVLDIPIDPSDPHDVQRYRLQRDDAHGEHRYPDVDTSRRLSFGALALPFNSPSFLTLPAVIYLLLGWSTQFATRTFDRRFDRSLDRTADLLGWREIVVNLFRNPVSGLVLLVVAAGLIGFAKPSADWSQGTRKRVMKLVMGLAHGSAQLAVGVGAGMLALKVASPFDGFAFNVVALVGLMALGALAAALTMGAYLAVCCRWFRSHGNEAYSSMGLGRYKNFLRLHIDRQGVLTIYPIGVDRPCRQWKYEPDAPREAPWLAPAGAWPRPRLIHEPVVVGAAQAGAGGGGSSEAVAARSDGAGGA